jgi:hypothetical protein
MSTNDLTVFFGLRLLRWARRTWALIARLFLGCCPSDVARLVVAVIVDAVNRVINRGGIADVIVEGEKVVFPFVAHGDASPAVIVERAVFGPVTSIFDRFPNSIDRCSAHVVFNPTHTFIAKLFEFCVARSGEYFFMQTSARSGISSSQVTSQNPKRVAAYTSALPIDASLVRFASAFGRADNGESSEYCIA